MIITPIIGIPYELTKYPNMQKIINKYNISVPVPIPIKNIRNEVTILSNKLIANKIIFATHLIYFHLLYKLKGLYISLKFFLS